MIQMFGVLSATAAYMLEPLLHNDHMDEERKERNKQKKMNKTLNVRNMYFY